MDLILWKCGGPRYRLRNGQVAAVVESNMVIATGQHIWQGRSAGQFIEWDDASLDIVGPET